MFPLYSAKIETLSLHIKHPVWYHSTDRYKKYIICVTFNHLTIFSHSTTHTVRSWRQPSLRPHDTPTFILSHSELLSNQSGHFSPRLFVLDIQNGLTEASGHWVTECSLWPMFHNNWLSEHNSVLKAKKKSASLVRLVLISEQMVKTAACPGGNMWAETSSGGENKKLYCLM